MKLGSKKTNRADQALANLMKEEHIPASVTAATAPGAGVDESKAAGPGASMLAWADCATVVAHHLCEPLCACAQLWM